MTGRSVRVLGALVGAAAVLVVAWWYDTAVMPAVQRAQAASFDMTQLAAALPVGYLLIAAGTLGIALLARWASSRLVEVVYVVVGTFWAFLFTVVWTVAAGENGAPPVLPDPLASALGQMYAAAETGPLNAVALIGAAMLLIGAGRLALSLRHRPVPVTGADGTGVETRPSLVGPPEVHVESEPA